MFFLNCEGESPLADSNYCNLDISTNLALLQETLDEDDYYHVEWIDGNVQTFSTLELQVNLNEYILVNWYSDTEFCIDWMYQEECVDIVNPQSVSTNGTSNQIMAVWEEMIGDTISIYSTFNWCQTQFLDSLKIIVDNDF